MSAQRPEYTRPVIDAVEAVQKYRANETQIRRLYGQLKEHGRNVNATRRAIKRREHDRLIIEGSLIFAGCGELAGHLVEERKLNERLAYAAQHGITRPELVARRVITRHEISRHTPKGTPA